MPTRGRRGSLRDGPAPPAVGFRECVGNHGGPTRGIRGPAARTLH